MAAPVSPHVNTVRKLITAVGVDNITQFSCLTNAQRMANDMFDNSFSSFMDNLYDEIDSDLKLYPLMTVWQGQICMQLEVKCIIKVICGCFDRSL